MKIQILKNLLFTILLVITGLLSSPQSGERILAISVTPNINTGQDYNPWLNDDVSNLIPNVWSPSNFQYIDITLQLEKRSKVTRISFYDYEGTFTDNPAIIYALHGTEKTVLGKFTGEQYMAWVEMIIQTPVVADAIVIHKYCNNIPQKIKVFGEISTDNPPPTVQANSIISFSNLPPKTMGDAPYTLVATSNNTAMPITFASSNNAVVSVTNTNGTWKATVAAAGTATITASQAGNAAYTAAADVIKTQVVQPAPSVPTSPAEKPIPGKIEAESFTTMLGIQTEITTDAGGGQDAGWIDDGDWMDYGVRVASTGNYTFNFRVASQYANGKIEVRSGNGTVLGSTAIPNTGGWQAWTTVNTSIPLTAGTQTLRIYAQKGGWNLNWFEAVNGVVTPPITASKIPIDPKRWYQMNNTSNGLEGLFDGNITTAVHTGWGHVLYNFDAYYPVLDGEELTIDHIKMYDGEGTNANDPVRLYVITTNWQIIPIATFTGSQYNKWVGPYPDKQTGSDDDFKLDASIVNAKYLVLNTSKAYPTEIEFYGTYKAPPPTTQFVKKPVTLSQTFGINAFEWDFEEPNAPSVIDEARMKAIKNFTGVRHYMDWEKLELQPGSYTFNPTHSGGWNYDAIYGRCKSEGIEVLACLKTIPGWMQNTYPSTERDYENVPVKSGSDFSNPASYIEQAKVAFQYSARYGSNKNVNPTLVSVNAQPRWGGDPVNTVKIGLGLIKYIECDNERDKWWKGRKAYQTGREYAANLSAFYDGHKNTMGPGVGIKNADSTMQVVMAGLASPNTDYVRGMIDWCKQYRGYKSNGSINLCWDIINYHLYSNDSKSSQSGNATRGTAPEISEAAEVAQNFLQMAHQYAYDMPVWVTECGYDVNQGSPFKAIPIGNKSVLETQADWILRTSLLYARSGIQRVFFYQLYDDNPANPLQFSSSGLINSNRTRKPAADYLYQTSKLFGRYIYKETLHNDPIVDRYSLNGQSLYMLVVPDEKGRTATYTLNLGGADSAYLYSPKMGNDAMELKKVKTSGGSITITVTETPLFVTGSGTANNNGNTGTATGRSINVTPMESIIMVNSNQINNTPGETVSIAAEKNTGSSLENRVRLYPNPATNYINLSIQNTNKSKVEVRILEAGSGKVLQTVTYNPAGTIREKLDLHSYGQGYYLIQIKQGANKITKKIFKTYN